MPRKQLCTIVTDGQECTRKVPEDVATSLCARHLLLAHSEVEAVGVGHLVAIVREEGP